MTRPEEVMANAGLIFIFTVWLQGQMSDLTILKKNPELVPDFLSSPSYIPPAFRNLRINSWERQFGDVKRDFVDAFSGELTAQELEDIEQLVHMRNMIAHAHVSVGRDYMLYRPSNPKKELAVRDAFKPERVQDRSDPLVLKLSFWKPDVFNGLSAQIERLDQKCFARLARSLGVPHGRIR